MMDSRPKDDGTVEVLYTPVAGATPGPMSLREGDKLKKVTKIKVSMLKIDEF